MENYKTITENIFEEYLKAWYMKKGKIQNLYIHTKKDQNINE